MIPATLTDGRAAIIHDLDRNEAEELIRIDRGGKACISIYVFLDHEMHLIRAYEIKTMHATESRASDTIPIPA